MDPTDEKILGILRQNARTSFSALGRSIGLSTNAAAARVRRLEESGIILGYTIVTEPGAPASGLEVFIDVRLDADTDGDTFTVALRPLRQVVDVVHLTGPFDYLLRAIVPDTAALDALLKRLKRSCGAAQTQTRVALRSPQPAAR